MRIGVDLDGPCYDFVDSLRKWLAAAHGRDLESMPPNATWDFYEEWGLTLEEWKHFVTEGVDAGAIFRHGDPIPGAVEGIAALRDRGHTIHIVTNRFFGTLSPQNTAGWLTEHGIEFESLTFSADKTLVDVDAFIEDNVENYQALEYAGIEAYLFDRPWNEHLGSARRVHTWEQFVTKIDELEVTLGLGTLP